MSNCLLIGNLNKVTIFQGCPSIAFTICQVPPPTYICLMRTGVNPSQDRGYSHHSGPGQLCGIGSLPLAFMQEDFFVIGIITRLKWRLNISWFIVGKKKHTCLRTGTEIFLHYLKLNPTCPPVQLMVLFPIFIFPRIKFS